MIRWSNQPRGLSIRYGLLLALVFLCCGEARQQQAAGAAGKSDPGVRSLGYLSLDREQVQAVRAATTRVLFPTTGGSS